MRVRSLGREDPLEEGMATHCSILAWIIPWTEELGGLQPMGSQRVGHDLATKPPPPYTLTYTHTHTHIHTYGHLHIYIAFPGGSDGKESACDMGNLGLSPGWEDPLEKGMATHSSILAWIIPWTEEPGELQAMGLPRVRYD